MLPYTPLHHLLLAAFDAPLVATSGNLKDEPICIDNDEALVRLQDIAELFLLHNRPIKRHVDDSIAWVLDDTPRLLRRARGYAPLPVLVKQCLPTILAVGAHQKNTIALSIGVDSAPSNALDYTQVVISQHIGDLETPQALDAFARVIADFMHLYQVEPVVLAHDMHPDYHSTHWVKTMHQGNAHTVAVQHHHAHLAACLADNQVTETALGITWDGTGYGPDGTIWGGECLLGNASGYRRVAHLRPFSLPGGEAAVRQPRRVALALLWEMYGEQAFELDLRPIQTLNATEQRILQQMLQRGLQSPRTTSAGRLFDGVAALIGLHPQVSVEGQAAIALEALADSAITDAYPLPIVTEAMPWVIDWSVLLEALLTDLRIGAKPSIMAAKFHNGLVQAMRNISHMVGVSYVALTGGCFQNRFLTERAVSQLRQDGFHVLLHRQVPPNDGGISLGQVMIAAEQYRLLTSKRGA